VPKFGARAEKWAICREDANFGTPHRFWQGEHHDIEAELRRFRPEPRPAFLVALGEDLQRRMHRPRIVRRTVFATAVTVAMLTVFATLGGVSYASSARTAPSM
jgi:hypothetical protein